MAVGIVKFGENLYTKFTTFTKSLNFQVSCEFHNDTKYHVIVNRHGGTSKLPPRSIVGQTVYKGFSVSLMLKFPNGHSERINFSWNQFHHKAHYISNVFKEQIEEYETKNPGIFKKKVSAAHDTGIHTYIIVHNTCLPV